MQMSSYDVLSKASTSYFKAYDVFPSSFNTLVSSGYLLFWPRNLSTGNPVQMLSDGGEVPSDELGFGTIGYKLLSESTALFNYASFGVSKLDDQDKWRRRTVVKPSVGDVNSPMFIGCNTAITEFFHHRFWIHSDQNISSSAKTLIVSPSWLTYPMFNLSGVKIMNPTTFI